MHINDITLQRVSTKSPLFDQIMHLMHDSFCDDELRNDDEFCAVVNSCPIFSVNAIMYGGEWCGVLTAWNFGKFLYVEHFAIDPDKRGHGLGYAVIEKLKTLCRLPIILEVELPEASDMAPRRIAFYKRCGFDYWNMAYEQPPYDQTKRSVPMKLMASGLQETPDNAHIVVALLYKHVYKVKMK